MLTTIEKALSLQGFDLFRFATADHLMQLAELCHEESYAEGETLFQQDRPSGKLFLLLQGRAAIEGSDLLLNPGTALNLWSCLAETGNTSTCRCAEECMVLALAVPDLLDLLGSEAELSLALLRHFAMQQFR